MKENKNITLRQFRFWSVLIFLQQTVILLILLFIFKKQFKEGLDAVRDKIAFLLKPFAEFCFNLVKPVSSGQAILIYILVLVAVAIWVLTLRQEKPKKEDWPGKKLFLHDLRLWAVIILVLQIGFYVIFR
ncbi:MAG: hypothetical protein ACYS1A_01570 [Planctomycetota bacterium]|jgi:hypothetical protein